jgi:hypothetical protein
MKINYGTVIELAGGRTYKLYNYTVIHFSQCAVHTSSSCIYCTMQFYSVPWKSNYCKKQPQAHFAELCFGFEQLIYTVKIFNDFPVHSRDVTNQTIPRREYKNYSRPGRVWYIPAGDGKMANLFLQCT